MMKLAKLLFILIVIGTVGIIAMATAVGFYQVFGTTTLWFWIVLAMTTSLIVLVCNAIRGELELLNKEDCK